MEIDREEEKNTVNCYQCNKGGVEEGTEHFPFCGKKCHKIWADENWGKSARRKQKYHTIEECQRRLKEMAEEKNPATSLF